ncbi:hypothetical protein [Desulfurivibrio sp. C05AmB]|uniref:hypothetical protein n=1 Tax=Desulfurivibrio sp. C05AmB TaxID=3374371 RepID=UPI00376EAC2A
MEHLQPWADEPGIIPVAGMTVIGCEVCHGAGSHHLATFPDHPNPRPDYQICGQCHGSLPEEIPAHFKSDFGNNILAKYLASSHGTSLLHQAEQPLCQRCHSDQGFRRHGAETAGLDGLALPGALQGAESFTGATPVQCRTCHDGHSGKLRAEATPGYSRLFNLCTSCHQVFLREDQTLDTSRPPYHGELDDEGYPVRADWVIWDTHFATADGFLAGYEIEPASERACTRCHDPHSGGAR